MAELSPSLAALPAEQVALWPRLAQIPDGFVLYGGTAVSLRLAHRESVDFEFFTSLTVDPDALLASIPFLTAAHVIQKEGQTLSVEVYPLDNELPVKVSFSGGIGFRVLSQPGWVKDNGVVVASLLDLAGTKAKVINQRIELKDYRDISALLDAGLTLPQIVAAAVAIFDGQVDYDHTLSAITYFEDETARTFPEPLKKKLRDAARGARRAPVPMPAYASIAASWDAARQVRGA